MENQDLDNDANKIKLWQLKYLNSTIVFVTDDCYGSCGTECY